MDRRGFLSSILVACAAPAIVRAGSLMRVVPRDTTIVGVDPGSVSVSGWTISYDGGETWRTYYVSGDSVVIQPGNTILRSPWIQFPQGKRRAEITNLRFEPNRLDYFTA